MAAPDRAQGPGEVRQALGCFGDHVPPHRGLGSYKYSAHQKDQDDADEHHLDLFDGLVDNRRERDYKIDGDEQPDGYVAEKILVDAERVGYRRGRACNPPGEEVGQDRPEDDDLITQKLLDRRGLASGLG